MAKRRSGGDRRRAGSATVWLCLVEAGPPRQASCAPVPADRAQEAFRALRASVGAQAGMSGAVGVLR